MPYMKMYFEGHCTIHTCQYNEVKFDSEIQLSVMCSFIYVNILSHSNFICKNLINVN